MSKEAKIQIIRAIVVVGFVFSILVCLAMRELFHRGYPYNTFLFDPKDRFNDFFNLQRIRYAPYEKLILVGNYFPLFYVLQIALNVAGTKAAFAVYMLGFLVFFLAYTWRQLRTSGRVQTLVNTLIFTFLTYPVLFALDRANSEIWEFALMCGFIYFFRQAEGTKAGLLLAVGGSLKPFPLLFLMLAAAERRWRDVLVCLMAVAVLSGIALRCLGPDMIGNLRGLSANLREYNRMYAAPGDEGMYFGHSLFGLLKTGIYFGARHHHGEAAVNQAVNHLAAACLVFAVLAVVGVTAYIATVEKTFWKKAALVVLAMDLLPLVSADYKLLDLFIPLFLFLNTKEKDLYDCTYTVLFALLLIPKAFYPVSGSLWSVGIVINPLLMMAMATLIIGTGLTSKRSEHVLGRRPRLALQR